MLRYAGWRTAPAAHRRQRAAAGGRRRGCHHDTASSHRYACAPRLGRNVETIGACVRRLRLRVASSSAARRPDLEVRGPELLKKGEGFG